uniref:HD domain-containing protein n=1 Tax=Desulfacinum infernum TaxID=35837 RepID=A0A831ZXW5_9BACT
MTAFDVQLTHRFREALSLAFDLHHAQRRKGSGVPYMAHVLAVASMVLENGGDENAAIAALLHDAVEDQGGETTLQLVRTRFGDLVADWVAACSDSLGAPKPPWRQRKENFLARLWEAPGPVLLIALADKIHNARCIVADLAREGPAVWDRFHGGRDGTLWYYSTLARLFHTRGLYPELSGILGELVEQMERAASVQPFRT